MPDYVSNHDGQVSQQATKSAANKLGLQRKNPRKIKGRQNIRVTTRRK